MPKFTIEDVDRDIEERRARARQSKTQGANRPNVLQHLLDKARLKIKGKPGEGEEGV